VRFQFITADHMQAGGTQKPHKLLVIGPHSVLIMLFGTGSRSTRGYSGFPQSFYAPILHNKLVPVSRTMVEGCRKTEIVTQPVIISDRLASYDHRVHNISLVSPCIGNLYLSSSRYLHSSPTHFCFSTSQLRASLKIESIRHSQWLREF
jgi:hypothetical protein